MTYYLKRGSALILVLLVIVITLLTLGEIWGIIDLEQLYFKAFKSLVVIFVAAAVLLFIFAVFFKPENPGPRGGGNMPPP